MTGHFRIHSSLRRGNKYRAIIFAFSETLQAHWLGCRKRKLQVLPKRHFHSSRSIFRPTGSSFQVTMEPYNSEKEQAPIDSLLAATRQPQPAQWLEYSSSTREKEDKGSIFSSSMPEGSEQLGRRPSRTFTVAQFNILASNLANEARFPYVMPYVLDWKTRKWNLLQEIKDLHADVICLQELSDFWTFFKPNIESLGYGSTYVKRPSINVSTWSGDKKMDGCAIFFRNSKFELLECESFNYRDDHDRVAVAVLLQLKGQEEMVVVTTTHLWWDSSKPEEQVRELEQLDAFLSDFVDSAKTKYNRDSIPLVLSGDLNNSPASPVYSYMYGSFWRKYGQMRSSYSAYKRSDGWESDGRQSRTEKSGVTIMRRPSKTSPKRGKSPPKIAHIGYSPELEDLHRQPVHLSTEHLPATTEMLLPGTHEPPHTSVNYRRCWTIDYIWHSELLRTSRVMKIPTESSLRAEEGPPDWLALATGDTGRLPIGLKGNHNGIPNSQHGSDHVPIMAELELL